MSDEQKDKLDDDKNMPQFLVDAINQANIALVNDEVQMQDR